jgi:hypothetical protein
VILGGPHQLLQTIYHDESQDLGAVAIDEESGKIATCSKGTIYIYQPFGQSEDVLKVKYGASDAYGYCSNLGGSGPNSTFLTSIARWK